MQSSTCSPVGVGGVNGPASVFPPTKSLVGGGGGGDSFPSARDEGGGEGRAPDVAVPFSSTSARRLRNRLGMDGRFAKRGFPIVWHTLRYTAPAPLLLPLPFSPLLPLSPGEVQFFFRLRTREWDDVKRRPSSDLRQLRFEMGQAPLTCGVSVRPGSAHKFEWKEERKGGCPMQGMRGGEEQEGGNLHKKSPSRIPPLFSACVL